MRIKQLNLKAFGPFSDYVIDFGHKGMLTLLYGLNEAGKSTLLRSIKDFFYGFPLRSPDAFLHPSNKLRIEAVLELEDGREIKLIRRKTKKNSLLDGEENPVDENLLQPYLGPIYRETFSLMFGMDHHSLRKGGEDLLKGEGALGEALFEAASGMGGLRELFAELDKEASSIFNPRGSKNPLNEQLERYRSIKKKIGELSLAPQQWEELEEKYHAEQKRSAQLKKEEKELTTRKARLARLQNTLPLLAARDKLSKELNQLGDVPLLPPEFKEGRLALLSKRSGAQKIRERAQNEVSELQKKIGQITVNDELLAHGDDVSNLQERLDTYRSSMKDIPSLQGGMAELQEEALTLLRRLNPSLTALAQAESLRLPHVLLGEMKKLVREYPVLLQKNTSWSERVAELERSLDKQNRERENIGPQKDVTGLYKSLQGVRKRGPLEQELKKNRSVVHNLERKLKDKLEGLGLWCGNSAELLSLPLPLDETVRLFERRYKEMEERKNKVVDKMEQEDKKLQDCRADLKAVEFAGPVPTEQELIEARRHRQQGWGLVRQAWLEGVPDPEGERIFGGEKLLPEAYEISVDGADKVADLLRQEASRVEQKNLLLSEIKKCEAKTEELKREKVVALEQGLELERQWKEVWAPAKIDPLTPAEMLAWLNRCREIREVAERLNEQYDLVKTLEEALQGCVAELRGELHKLGEPVAGITSLEGLTDRAQEVCERYQAGITRLQSIEAMCKELTESLQGAKEQKKTVEKSLARWEEKWAGVLESAALPHTTTVEAASSYMELLEDLFQKISELNRKQIDLNKRKNYTKDFQSRLQKLLEQLAPDLGELPADHAALQLQARVTGAQQEKDRKANLEQQLEKELKILKQATLDIEEANRGLRELVAQARCRDEGELPQAEIKSMRLAELQEKLEGLEGQLLSLGGGLLLEEIIAEAEGVEIDELARELDELELALAQNRAEQDSLNQVFGVTMKEYKEKVKGASLAAVEAAEEGESILARMGTLAEQYLRLRLASIVLRRGIERYREQNQNPVIREAGELFARLTRGSFAGLKVDFDEKDNPVLLGLRPSGEGVGVRGMSDGTLDQLYLSLRLASLQRYLEQHEPLPFILDDLLVNFDDIRAAETLKVLAEFASKTQVLFFTHHRSLLDLEKHHPESMAVCNLAAPS